MGLLVPLCRWNRILQIRRCTSYLNRQNFIITSHTRNTITRGYKYQKAGAILSGLVDTQARQADLFGLSPISNKTEVMGVIDAINARMGRGTIRLASEGITKNWLMRRDNKSQNYTTGWDELICVTK